MRTVKKWTTVGRAFERTSPYEIATCSRALELRATDREEETGVEMRSDFHKGCSMLRHVEVGYHSSLAGGRCQ